MAKDDRKRDVYWTRVLERTDNGLRLEVEKYFVYMWFSISYDKRKENGWQIMVCCI